MISQAATLWIRDPEVSLEKLKTALAQEHGAGAQITFWNRRGLTVVHLSLRDREPEAFHSRAQSLAEDLEREVLCLVAFTGSASGSEVVAFDASGRESWSLASPNRASAESRRIEKTLGLRLLAGAQVERLEDREEDPADDATLLKDLPYWKLHAALELPGKRPLVDLWTKPALETLGSGWTKLEYWATPEQEQQAAARASSADRLRPQVEVALKKLAQRAGKEKVTVFHAAWSYHPHALRLSIATEQSEARAMKKLKARSTVLRKSPLARRTGLRSHEASFISERIKSEDSALEDALTPELVQRFFGPTVEMDGILEGGGFQGEESDPSANAWNSLIELSNPDVVQVLGEMSDRGLDWLFKGKLLDEVREYIQADLCLFAPLLADALLAEPENDRLETFSWVLLEPEVKKLAKNPKYLETLKRLFAVTKKPRYLEALQRVGLPKPKWSPSKELLNAADYR